MNTKNKLKRITEEEEQLILILRAVKLPAAQALSLIATKIPMLNSIIELSTPEL